jgi:LysM repeat protein
VIEVSATARWISRASVVIALSVLIALAGCGDTPTPSTYSPLALPHTATHVVVEGDTLFRIANEFGVSVGRLMAANQISDPRELRVGQVLTIPGAGYRAASIGTASSGVLPYSGERASRQFQWPVAQGVVSSGFGIRNGAMHDGVDIAAPVGTPVLAADSGVVIFSGVLHGYGNTVIIRHDDGLRTQLAKPGQREHARGLRTADRRDWPLRTHHRREPPFRGAPRQHRAKSARLFARTRNFRPDQLCCCWRQLVS